MFVYSFNPLSPPPPPFSHRDEHVLSKLKGLVHFQMKITQALLTLKPS